MEQDKLLDERLNDYLENSNEVEDLDNLLDQLEQELSVEILSLLNLKNLKH